MTTAPDPSAGLQRSTRPTRALAGVAVALALANAIATVVWSDSESIVQFAIAYALLAFEPIAFGVWVALGHGSILKRAVVVVPILLLLFVSPGYIPDTLDDVRRFEFIQLVLVGFAALIVSTMIFLVFRVATRFRILPSDAASTQGMANIRFSILHLLVLTTLYALALGLMTGLNLDSKPRADGWIIGANFYFYIYWVGGSILASIVMPTMAVPLLILHGRPSLRAVVAGVLVWASITFASGILMTINDYSGLWEFLGGALLTQMCAAIIGALTAIWLRWNGLRLVRPPRSERVDSTIALPSP